MPAILLLALLSTCACEHGGPTETIVVVGAQPCARAAARAARVRVFGNDGATVLDMHVSLVPGVPGATSLPLRIPVVPRGGDASRRFWVDAVLLDDAGAPIGAARVGGRFVAGQISAMSACVADACMGVGCGACEPPGDCTTCLAHTGRCSVPEPNLVPFEEAADACPALASSECAPANHDGGVSDGSTPDVSDAGALDAGPPGCASDGECDDGSGCTTDRCVDDVCVHERLDGDGDGYVADGCGGDDCNDANAGVHPNVADICNGADDNCSGAPDEGVPENCGNRNDDDCDGSADCWDTDCAPACQQQRCNPGFPQFRWCGSACVNTNQPGNCGGCGIVCRGTACRTDLGDGRPRCGCTSDANCPGTHCNLAHHACACTGAASCGPNAHCAPGGGLPAYCAFNF